MGRPPKKFEVEAHASVPPIFGEVVLRGAGKKYEVTKKGKKGDMWYIADLRQAKNPKRRLTTKKGHKKFSALKWKFVPKKSFENLFREIFLFPKLDAKSPPMALRMPRIHVHVSLRLNLIDFDFF